MPRKKQTSKKVSIYDAIREWIQNDGSFSDGIKLLKNSMPQNPGFIANMESGETPQRAKQLKTSLQNFVNKHNPKKS